MAFPGMDNFDLKEVSDLLRKYEVEKASLAYHQATTPPGMSVSPEIMDQCTQRYSIIGSQETFIQMTNMAAARVVNKVMNGGFMMREMVTSGYQDYTANAPVDILDRKNLVGIKDLMKNVDQVMKGKFFLCRTITPSSKAMGVVEMGVEDPKGKRAVRLAVYSFSEKANVPGTDFEGVVPKGAYLVVKNPWFRIRDNGTLGLKSDSPGNVEMISEKEVKEKFSDCKWRPTLRVETPSYFWDQMTLASYSDQDRMQKLKHIGNRAWVEKRFTDAIRWYKLGLDYANEPADRFTILNNMTAALMGMECWNAALKCVEEALQINGADEKALYRKGKCLMGLEKWEEAIKFLEDSTSGSGIFKKMLEEVRECQRMTNNPNLLKEHWHGINKSIPIVSYKGPVAIANIPGKGRGLIATQPLVAGQLILVSKTFVSKHADPSGDILTQTKTYDEMIFSVVNKIVLEPELGKEFYSLTAGKELGHLDQDNGINGLVDMKRIHSILGRNAYKMMVDNQSVVELLRSPHLQCEICIPLSFMNHNCSPNSIVSTMNNFAMVKVLRNVKEGEELTTGYLEPRIPYDERKIYLQTGHGFACNCELCLLDASEPKSIHDRRATLLEQCRTLSSPEKVLEAIQEIINLRKSKPELNMALVNEAVVSAVEKIALKKYRLQDCISVLEKMFDVQERNPCIYSILQEKVLILMLHCFIQIKYRKKVKDCVKKIKEVVLTYDGRWMLDLIKNYPEFQVFIHVLKSEFNIDFLQD